MFRRAVVAVIAAVLLSGCVDSEIKSFTDPDYKEARFDRLLVNLAVSPATKAQAEKPVLQVLTEAGIAAAPIEEVLVPTRTYSPEEAAQTVAKSDYPFVLVLKVVDSNSSTTVGPVIGNTYGTATQVGNRVNYQGSTVATPIVIAKGQTAIEATVFDTKTGRKAWIGNVLTKAGGTAFVGNVPEIAKSAAFKIVEQLKADGHR